MDASTILNSAFAALPVLFVVLGLRPVTDREIATFSARHFLPVDVMSSGLPVAIARSRGMRLVGAAVGLSLPALVLAFAHDSLGTGSALLWGAAGYLGGALLAALVPFAHRAEPVHSATLVPRRARDYLPLGTLALPGVMVILSLLASAAYALTPRRPFPSISANLVGGLVLSVAAALVTLVGTRWVVRRPQPVPDREVLASDDALRSHGLHLVVGTGVAIGAFAASATSFELGGVTSIPVLRWVSLGIGLCELMLALRAWSGLGHDSWSVLPKVPA